MNSCKIFAFVLLAFICCFGSAPCIFADIICDATLTTIDPLGSERVDAFKAYVKSNKVKLERVEDSGAIILRSDLQVLLNIIPQESSYTETSFSQFYTTPFGPSMLVIPPGFSEPVVELVDTGETTVINSMSCKKYVINEIAPFRLLQYTIYATEELALPESFGSFFSSDFPTKYKPFEEMRKIPGLPLKITVAEVANGNSYFQTYVFSNHLSSTLSETIFNIPGGYTLR